MFKLLQTDGLGSKCKDRKNEKNFLDKHYI